MRLTIGITQLLPEWEIIMQQIGLTYEIISLEKSLLPDQYSVIIVTRRETKIKKNIFLGKKNKIIIMSRFLFLEV